MVLRVLLPVALLPGAIVLVLGSCTDSPAQRESEESPAERAPDGSEPPDPEPATPAIDAAEPLDASARPDMDAALPQREDAAAAPDASDTDAGMSDAADAAVPCVPFVPSADCTVPADGVLPRELRCTGLYGDFTSRTLACGVEAYAPAFELWSDGSEKQRYVALPDGSAVDVSDPEDFRYPVGTRFWKEFRVRVGGQSKLAETRLLEKSERGWLYTTYVWSEDGQSAMQRNDGLNNVHGSEHSVPTRDQCRDCHEGRPDFVLGWDMLMLGEGASGLTRERLAERGLLQVTSATGETSRPSTTALGARVPGDELERAALGYLHANCGVSCHNESELASGRESNLLMRLDLDRIASAQTAPVVSSGVNRLPGLNAKLPVGGPYYDIAPGHPEHSLLLARMRTRDETQMPPLATRQIDGAGVALIERWIAGMSVERGYPTGADLDGGVAGSVTFDGGTEADGGAPDASVEEPDAGADAGVTCTFEQAPRTEQLSYDVVVSDPALQTLTFAAQPPESDDWYLVEMRGRIMRFHEGALAAIPFLDLTSAIELGAGFDQTTSTYDERGLVGLAFAPDYAASGLFYVAVTPSRSNTLGLPANHDLVLEYQRADGAPILRRTLLDVPSAPVALGNIHNCNTVRFGPDGMLYVGMGDGGGVRCNDAEPNAAQDIGSVFGKLLRLDLSRPAPYGALDNPFVDTAGGDPRVFHYGLRNPFRFSFDRATGDLYLGDVGQNRYEELNYAARAARGLNFGWAAFEAAGRCPSANRPQREGSVHTLPIFAADRTGSGLFRDYRAIVGGVVYRGRAIPTLSGSYLFGDYYGARLGALTQCGARTSPIASLRKSCDPNFPEPCLPTPENRTPFRSLTAIVEDHVGEVYFVANGDSLLKLTARP